MCLRCALLSLLAAVGFDGRASADGWQLGSGSPEASALHGRLWNGLTKQPITDGYVFVLDHKREIVLGPARSLAARGRDAGSWQITGLPPKGRVWVVGFHPATKEDLAVKQVVLNGSYKGVRDLTTHASLPETLSDANIYALLGTVAREANRIMGDKAASEFATHLANQIPDAHMTSAAQKITPSTLGDYPKATRIGDDQKAEDYYVCRQLRTQVSLRKVKGWYLKQAALKKLPLVSEEWPTRIAIKEHRYGMRSDPFGQQLILTFVCKSQEDATPESPQIIVQITEDNRPKYGPTRITYRFWGPPREK